MTKIMVLYNDGSGDDQGVKLAEKFKEFGELEHNKRQITLQLYNEETDKDKLVERVKTETFEKLVIIGGDGTIHHVIKDFEDLLPQLKIGIIPGGTVNNFAKSLGLSEDDEENFQVILADQTRQIDYGKVDQDVIISTLTIGILADTAARVSQTEKQKFGPLAFAKRFLHLLLKKRKYHLTIETEEKTWQVKTQLVTVYMTNSAGGFTNFDENAAPDDGLLHLIVLPRLRLGKILWYLPKIMHGEINQIDDILYSTAKNIKISGQEKKIETRTDGDPSDDLPIEIKVIPGGLTVLAPDKKH